MFHERAQNNLFCFMSILRRSCSYFLKRPRPPSSFGPPSVVRSYVRPSRDLSRQSQSASSSSKQNCVITLRPTRAHDWRPWVGKRVNQSYRSHHPPYSRERTDVLTMYCFRVLLEKDIWNSWNNGRFDTSL